MKPTAPKAVAPDANRLARDVRKRMMQVVIMLLMLGAILFLSAGRGSAFSSWIAN